MVKWDGFAFVSVNVTVKPQMSNVTHSANAQWKKQFFLELINNIFPWFLGHGDQSVSEENAYELRSDVRL